MSTPTTALVFVGLLLVVIGLFVAGSISFVALGVASLFGAGVLGAIDGRGAQ